MLNYVKSELYRTLHSRGYLVFFGICCLLPLLIPLFSTGNQSLNDVSFSLSGAVSLLGIVAPLTLPVADMVFGGEYKNNTLKNTLAHGYSRTQIYFGKFMAQIFAAFTIALIAFGLFSAGTFLLLENSPEAAPMIRSFYTALAGCVPVWMSTLALSNAILFNIRSDTAGSFLFIGILYLPDVIFSLISFWFPGVAQVLPYLIGNQTRLVLAPFFESSVLTFDDLGRTTLVSLAYLAVSLALGLILFRRKEL